MKRFVMYWALAGVLVPVAVLILSGLEEFLGRVFGWLSLAVYLWPSWILMGATYERELTAFGVTVLAVSVVINAALYSAIGAIVWLLFNRVLE
jgi:hypothetical protein